LKARPSGLASPSLPTGEGEAKQALPGALARPKQPPTFASEMSLLKEVFRIIKLGAKLTMTFTRPEGAKVS